MYSDQTQEQESNVKVFKRIRDLKIEKRVLCIILKSPMSYTPGPATVELHLEKADNIKFEFDGDYYARSRLSIHFKAETKAGYGEAVYRKDTTYVIHVTKYVADKIISRANKNRQYHPNTIIFDSEDYNLQSNI